MGSAILVIHGQSEANASVRRTLEQALFDDEDLE